MWSKRYLQNYYSSQKSWDLKVKIAENNKAQQSGNETRHWERKKTITFKITDCFRQEKQICTANALATHLYVSASAQFLNAQ